VARRFSTSPSRYITTSLGALGFAFGPGTLAMVVRVASAPGATIAASGAGVANTASYGLELTTGLAVQLRCNANTSVATGITITANAWHLIAASKDTGTVAPTIYARNLSTYESLRSAVGGTAIANSSSPITQANIGADSTTGVFFDGDIAQWAAWNAVLTAGQIDSLSRDLSPANWTNQAIANLKGLLHFPSNETGSTEKDLSGGGANAASDLGTLAVDEVPGLGLAPIARSKVGL
jgi:hypothetical protein